MSTSKRTELFIPKMGQTVEEVTIIAWLVEDGALVEAGQPVLEIETDKAVFPVEAPAGGTLHRGPFNEGDIVPVVTTVAIIGAQDDVFSSTAMRSTEDNSAPASPDTEHVPHASINPPALPADQPPSRTFASPRARRLASEKHIDITQVSPTGDRGQRVVEADVIRALATLGRQPKASPLANKLAAEAGLPIETIPGSGPGGRVMRVDVLGQMGPLEPAAQPGAQPSFQASSSPANEVVEWTALAGVRGLIAGRMADSAHSVARVTLVIEADATELVALRQRLKARLEAEWGFVIGYNDLLAKMVAVALHKFPYMNARIAGDPAGEGLRIERLAHINLGMAVDTERGLLVPVVRDADRKSLRQFGDEFRQLVERARNRKSLPDDLSGGTFTITNLGMYDIDAFTPIINLPEAAILGVGRIAPRVVPHQGEVAIRSMLTLSLAFDHRLVDGAPAARFLKYIKDMVEEPYLLIGEST